jgi:transcriptional regulator with XRE-family HTH domain
METLASNIRAFRQLRGMEQDKLAKRMQSLGYMWRQVTVSEVERGRRNVTVPELLALTLALAATVEQLLDPRGPERRRGPWLALSDQTVEISEETDHAQVRPAITPIAPTDVSALVCSHKIYAEVEWYTDRHVQVAFKDGRPDLTDVGPEGAPS